MLNLRIFTEWRIFDIQNDILEENSLNVELLNEKENLILEKLSKQLSKFPSLTQENEFK